jgi:hypothetical protein
MQGNTQVFIGERTHRVVQHMGNLMGISLLHVNNYYFTFQEIDFIPETFLKNIKIHWRFLIDLGSQEEKRGVASAYYRAKRPLGLNLSNEPTTIPLSDALANILVNTSATKFKSKGDRGYPCLKPLSVLKVGLSSPFTTTLFEPPITIFLIHLIYLSLKPLSLRISSRNSRLTLS